MCASVNQTNQIFVCTSRHACVREFLHECMSVYARVCVYTLIRKKSWRANRRKARWSLLFKPSPSRRRFSARVSANSARASAASRSCLNLRTLSTLDAKFFNFPASLCNRERISSNNSLFFCCFTLFFSRVLVNLCDRSSRLQHWILVELNYITVLNIIFKLLPDNTFSRTTWGSVPKLWCGIALH